VPHITNRDPVKAAYEEGYAVAEDRLWELEILRLQSEGRLAEIFGPTRLPGTF